MPGELQQRSDGGLNKQNLCRTFETHLKSSTFVRFREVPSFPISAASLLKMLSSADHIPRARFQTKVTQNQIFLAAAIK